jgi:hypothetical protein
MQLIATRHCSDWHLVTLEPFELQDRMYRKACGSFVLMVAGEWPGDPAVEEFYSLEQVFEWLRECPQQIERGVIVNTTAALPESNELGDTAQPILGETFPIKLLS